MQVLIIIISILSLLLFRRLKLHKPWSVILLLIVSGIATFFCFVVMVKWSEVPLEQHNIFIDQLYKSEKTKANFVTANITIYLYTSYDFIFKEPHDRKMSIFFQYDEIDSPSTMSQLFENHNVFTKNWLYNALKNTFSQLSDIDSVDYISKVQYIYPSSISQPEIRLSQPHFYEEDKSNIFSHYCMYSNTIQNEDIDSLRHRLKPYLNVMDVYALTKGMSKSSEKTFEYNHRPNSFWEKIMFLVQANDLSRTNYFFVYESSSVDSLNLSFRFEEPSEIYGIDKNTTDLSPYYITESRKINKNNKKSLINFHARHIESENIQSIRMFIISSICAIFLGFFFNTFLSCIGFAFNFIILFTTKTKCKKYEKE